MKNYKVIIYPRGDSADLPFSIMINAKSIERAIATAEKKFKAQNKKCNMDNYGISCDQILDEVTTEYNGIISEMNDTESM